jgi:hypothetical protein
MDMGRKLELKGGEQQRNCGEVKRQNAKTLTESAAKEVTGNEQRRKRNYRFDEEYKRQKGQGYIEMK